MLFENCSINSFISQKTSFIIFYMGVYKIQLNPKKIWELDCWHSYGVVSWEIRRTSSFWYPSYLTVRKRVHNWKQIVWGFLIAIFDLRITTLCMNDKNRFFLSKKLENQKVFMLNCLEIISSFFLISNEFTEELLEKWIKGIFNLMSSLILMD